MTHKTVDPRINELLELVAAEGRSLAVHPEAILQAEDCGLTVDPFSGAVVLPVLRWVTLWGHVALRRGPLVTLVILVLLASSLPAVARAGGSGITPPI